MKIKKSQMTLCVSKQTEAEQDNYLVDCFHDANFIDELLKNKYTLITGRKGTGKTALAKFLQKKHKDYGIAFSHRLSVDEFSGQFNGEFEHLAKEMSEIILFYILTKTVQLLLKNNHLNESNSQYWTDFLTQNGLQDIDNYKAFAEWASEHESGVDLKIAKGKNVKHHKKTPISNCTGGLFDALSKSLIPNKKILIFIDDLTDYLDRVNKQKFSKEIDIVRDILLRIDKYNSTLRESNKELSFVCCIRNDLWRHMEGSNTNKLINNSLNLVWNEKSFCSLLIRRLPFFLEEQDKALKNPEEYIKKQFPNEVFSKILKTSNTKKFKTNFYAYIMAVSFNRPRDYLRFCYAMRNRLSTKRPVELINIESAEREFSDYLIKEIKDELFWTSKMLGVKGHLEGLEKLIYLLGKKESFGYAELKIELSKYLGKTGKASHSLTLKLIKELWWYGILGFNRDKGIINFRYMGDEKFSPVEEVLKDYSFSLHRGLLWTLKKQL